VTETEAPAEGGYTATAEAPPQPPPAPPPGATTGLPSRLASTLAYLAWWLTGLLFLVLERRDSHVRFHAMQSVLTFGTVSLAAVALGGLALLLVMVSYTAMRFVGYLAQVVWIAGVVLWVVCMMKAYAGERWKVPVIGQLAEDLTKHVGERPPT
jgi:uncharacterized membrane protein